MILFLGNSIINDQDKELFIQIIHVRNWQVRNGGRAFEEERIRIREHEVLCKENRGPEIRLDWFIILSDHALTFFQARLSGWNKN